MTNDLLCGRNSYKEQKWFQVSFCSCGLALEREESLHNYRERPLFGYLCEECAQKKLADWLQCAQSPDYVILGYLMAFDSAAVYY